MHNPSQQTRNSSLQISVPLPEQPLIENLSNISLKMYNSLVLLNPLILLCKPVQLTLLLTFLKPFQKMYVAYQTCPHLYFGRVYAVGNYLI